MRFPARAALLGAAALLLAVAPLPVAGAASATSAARASYVVTTTPGSPAAALVQGLGGVVRFRYRHALHGFSVSVPAGAGAALRALPGVLAVEPVRRMAATGSQGSPPSYGLDRVDQRSQPLDGTYRWGGDGTGVTAYVIDTGIAYGHSDFAGRALKGFDAETKGGDASDCNGHGTHVAGTLGGSTFGVAKRVALVSVRVLDCSGSGTADVAIAGIDWMVGNHLAGVPAVANMSIATNIVDTALDDAVKRAIADGIVFVAAAGNNGGLINDLLGWSDACRVSPADVPDALTVGATDAADHRATYSDVGTCLDVWAPGDGIISADYQSTTGSVAMSGTSMAAPHVAGAAAVYLARHRGASVAQVTQALLGAATTGVVQSPGAGSPNRFLYQAW